MNALLSSLLVKAEAPKRAKLLSALQNKVPAFMVAARQKLQDAMPERGGALQHSITGAIEGLTNDKPMEERTRKTGGGGKADSPHVSMLPPSKRTSAAGLLDASITEGVHTPRLDGSAGEILQAIRGLSFSSPQSTEELTSVRSDLSKARSDLETIRSQHRDALNAETLRADRAEQALQSAILERDTLRTQVSGLMTARATPPGEASGSSGEITRLDQQIQFLQSQNAALLMMVAGQQAEASKKLAELVVQTRPR
jgi:hypothetical protein